MSNTPANIKYSDKGTSSKTPIILSLVAGVVAAAVSVWGISSGGQTAGVSPDPKVEFRELADSNVNITPPENAAEKQRLIKAGASLHQQSCAGCHNLDSKLVGPSYTEIVRKYRQGSNSPISEIAFASTHPPTTWDGYDLGPHLHLTKDEQRALAVWIVESSQKAEKKDRGND